MAGLSPHEPWCASINNLTQEFRKSQKDLMSGLDIWRDHYRESIRILWQVYLDQCRMPDEPMENEIKKREPWLFACTLCKKPLECWGTTFCDNGCAIAYESGDR